MEHFLTLPGLALIDVSNMIAGGLDILHLAAIALILVFFGLRMGKKEDRSGKTSGAGSAARDHQASGRFFERRHISRPKKCPNCSEQLPLLALLCESCDYNFLAERPGRGQKLLPPPQEISAPEKPVYELTVLHREDLPSVSR